MKNTLTIALSVLLLAFAMPAFAQKYACVNTDYVLKSMPDYANAQQRLDRYVTDWKKELDDKNSELMAMRAEYEQESYLLPENLKKRRQEEIKTKEQEIRDLQQQRFGPGGDLDKRRAELLKPVQDRVYSTIERVAHEKNYAFVFDKAGSNTLLFANKKYDISDEVLELMGINPNATKQQELQSDEKPKAKRPSNNEMNAPGANRTGRDVGTPLGGNGLKKK
ncbi:MAG: OmpH family outer membrane protein [Bacteroidales bacterium]|nr:OmpH family outer membrane protein [Bacteroidales bacterium]